MIRADLELVKRLLEKVGKAMMSREITEKKLLAFDNPFGSENHT